MTMDAQETAEEGRYQAVQAVDVRAQGASDLLVRALYDSSWRVRKRAAERLATVPDRPALVQRLLLVLADRGQTGARNAAAEALVHLGHEAVAPVIGLLRHHDPDQRKFAADILGLIGAREAAQPLAQALADPDANVRVSAAEALGLVGGDAAPRALEQALAQPDALLRLSVLEALERLEAPPPLPTLVSLLSEPALRKVATRLLGFVRQPAALKEISRALTSDAGPLREAALAAVGRQLAGDGAWTQELERECRPALRRDPAFLTGVAEALEQEDAHVRRGALFCLSLSREPRWVRRVADAAEDDQLAEDVVRALVRMGPAAAKALAPDLETLGASARIVAAEALVELADPSLVPALEELTDSGEPEVRLLAVRALGRSQASAALPRLAALLTDLELSGVAGRALVELSESLRAEVRTALEVTLERALSASGVRALGKIAGADALPTLRQAAKHPEPSLRAAAAEAAGEAGAAAADLLRTLLSDEMPDVRAAAARALSHLPAEKAAPLLRLALQDEDVELRAAALDAVADGGLAELETPLRALLEAPQPFLAMRAVKALSRMGRFDGAALDVASRHPDPEVVREALSAGAALAEGVALSRRLLRHERWDLRASAARVLASSGGQEAQAEIDEALSREQDPLVRDALQQARSELSRR